MNFKDIQQDIPQVDDFKNLYNSTLVDLSEEIKHPEILLSIGSYEFKGNKYPIPVMTAGEMSAIVAPSKSKKSFLKSALIASYIRNNELFPSIQSHRNKDYTVIDIDTEQGNFYAQRTFRRVAEMSGLYSGYYSFATRSKTSKERLMLVDGILKNQESLYKEPIKLIAIDGIADLVDNTNDIEMSKEASDYIMKWTDLYGVHILNVIHKNFETNKPVGHLGSYVVKKAETIFALEKNKSGKEIIVTNPYSRGYAFNQFEFDVNSNGLPYEVFEGALNDNNNQPF